MSMKKNSTAQRGGNGMLVTASAYTTKARPDPDVTNSGTVVPWVFAMNPRKLKITNPANTDVEQFAKAITIASLIKEQ